MVIVTLLTGLAAGAGHALSGPDHLAAVAPLAVDQRVRAWRVGFLWGAGHSGGVWILAVLALLFREALPIDLLSAWGERLVGFVLVGIGLFGFHRLFGSHIHSHVHEHDGLRHEHIHIHIHKHESGEPHPLAQSHTHGVLGLGALHGLAGVSHLLGVLPAMLLSTRLAAVVYVVSFGIGSIIAMTGFSWLLSLVANRFERSGNRMYRLLLGSSSATAIAVGCYWCLHVFRPLLAHS